MERFSYTVKALYPPQNASIISDSHTYLLCPKLCWHNRSIPRQMLSGMCDVESCQSNQWTPHKGMCYVGSTLVGMDV